MHTWICLLILQSGRRLTEYCHLSTSYVHVMKMMLTRAMALRAKGYKVMQHLYWHSVSMLLNQMYDSITNVYSECKVSGVKPGGR